MVLSVQFFRRLFIGLLVALILIPVILSIRFGVSAQRAKQQAAQLQGEVQRLQQSPPVASPPRQEDNSALPVNFDTQTAVKTDSVTPLPYQTLYPQLYCEAYAADHWQKQEQTVYLTFDGGPSVQTGKILDILDEAGIKATFFIVATGNEQSYDLLDEIVRRGHTLGVHSYSDDYTQIYESVEAYLADYQAACKLIADKTATVPSVFRFAGGSINAYNGGFYQQLIAEMTRRGFTYYDWDVVGDDRADDAASVRRAVLDGVRGKSRSIVLMHDTAGKHATVEALPGIISALKEQNYSFAPLTPEVEPVRFHYTD